jgi:hypothetical protein
MLLSPMGLQWCLIAFEVKLPRIISRNLSGYGDKRRRQKRKRRIQNLCLKKNL